MCSALAFEQSALQTEGRGLQSTLLTTALAASSSSSSRDVPTAIASDLLGRKQQPECKERIRKGEGQYIKEREEMCADNNQPTVPWGIFPAQNSMAQHDQLPMKDPKSTRRWPRPLSFTVLQRGTAVHVADFVNARVHAWMRMKLGPKACSFSWQNIRDYLKGSNSTCSASSPTNMPRKSQSVSEEHCWDTVRDGPVTVVSPHHASWVLFLNTTLWELKCLLSPSRAGQIRHKTLHPPLLSTSLVP